MHLLNRASSAVSSLRLLKSGIRLVGPPATTKKVQQIRYLNEEARDRVRALRPGDQIHGYTVQRVEELPDFFITAAMLRHDKTGAEHLHAARDDSNNTFSVTFRTTPLDSTGVPHILEHTVLCGSERFPVRDPFFKMLSRSMATFMNALTAYDWTMYPFSSQSEQDFKNLMSVYMDAAFFPLIREMDFLQEGWRLEHTQATDSSTPIIFKGVVYNEMKGVFSNPQSEYQQQCLNNLLPSHTYGVVSGGDPAHIPELTHQQLQEFHATHYHPSNAKFFTYGDLPLEEHLEFINSSLEKFEQIPVTTQVPDEKRWTEPRSKHITCVSDPMAVDPDKQTTVSVSYLLSDITDTYESFVTNMMCYLMSEGETSPFYRALLESNIGSDYAPTTGYGNHTKESTFSVGLLNIHRDDVDKVLKIIDETIEKVIEEGFEKKRIEALLHQIELGQKHESSNFGFNLAIGMASVWTHDGDPIALMQTNRLIEKFTKDYKENPKMLQERVKKYLKDNPHRLTLTMSPDAGVSEQRVLEENQRLEKLVKGLTEEDRKSILERGGQLEEKQSETEDLSCLPSLKVSDLDTQIKPEPIEMTQAVTGTSGNWSFIQCCEQPTNGVTYLRMASNLDGLPDDLMPYVPLFCDVITSIGAENQDFRWMSQRQELYTGGLRASPAIITHHSKLARLQRAVLFSSHCLEKNLTKMLDLWKMIINSPNFSDRERLSTLIKMSASNLASSLADSGHRYAVVNSASTLDVASQLQESMMGYSQVRTMKQIAESADLSDVIHNLQSIGHLVLDKTSIRLSLNTTPSVMDHTVKEVKEFLAKLKGDVDMAPIFPELDQIAPTAHQTQLELPFSVNYVAQSFPAVYYTHKDYSALNVLGTLMSRKFLHREIREKGGAYGSGAQLNDGTFSFFSYRDPRSLETLDVFSECVEWAVKGDFTTNDVEEAKLGVFQKIDKPVVPGNRGQTRFLYDISDDMRQTNRGRLFDVKGDDLQRVAEKYLNPNKVSGKAFLGPKNEKLDDTWTVVREEESGE